MAEPHRHSDETGGSPDGAPSGTSKRQPKRGLPELAADELRHPQNDRLRGRLHQTRPRNAADRRAR